MGIIKNLLDIMKTIAAALFAFATTQAVQLSADSMVDAQYFIDANDEDFYHADTLTELAHYLESEWELAEIDDHYYAEDIAHIMDHIGSSTEEITNNINDGWDTFAENAYDDFFAMDEDIRIALRVGYEPTVLN